MRTCESIHGASAPPLSRWGVRSGFRCGLDQHVGGCESQTHSQSQCGFLQFGCHRLFAGAKSIQKKRRGYFSIVQNLTVHPPLDYYANIQGEKHLTFQDALIEALTIYADSRRVS